MPLHVSGRPMGERMELSRKTWITVAIATGALLGTAGIAGAVTASSTTTNPPATSGSSARTSNTDPAHEAGESAQRQADEASGKFGGGPGGHSNTDPTHEAKESPARQAEEAQRDADLQANGGPHPSPLMLGSVCPLRSRPPGAKGTTWHRGDAPGRTVYCRAMAMRNRSSGSMKWSWSSSPRSICTQWILPVNRLFAVV